MHSITNLPVPGFKRTTEFWLTALLLGSIPVFLYNILGTKDLDESLLVTAAIVISTVAFSLPSLLLLCLLIPWALASPSLAQRWLRLVSVQSISAGTAFWLIYYTILNNHADGAIPLIAFSYFILGLLAAYWRHSAWLTHSV